MELWRCESDIWFGHINRCRMRTSFFLRMFITNVLAYWQTAEKRNKFRKRKWFCGIYRRLFSLFLFLRWLIAGVCFHYSKTSSCRESDFGCIRLFMQNTPRLHGPYFVIGFEQFFPASIQITMWNWSDNWWISHSTELAASIPPRVNSIQPNSMV